MLVKYSLLSFEIRNFNVTNISHNMMKIVRTIDFNIVANILSVTPSIFTPNRPNHKLFNYYNFEFHSAWHVAIHVHNRCFCVQQFNVSIFCIQNNPPFVLNFGESKFNQICLRSKGKVLINRQVNIRILNRCAVFIVLDCDLAHRVLNVRHVPTFQLRFVEQWPLQF